MQKSTCSLCQGTDLKDYFRDEKRQWTYFQCGHCDFVFRDPQTYLVSHDEKARYETHNNSIENEGYVKFLSPAVKAISQYLQPGDEGLDFGSGPGPIIDQLMKPLGFEVINYDPHFDNKQELLEVKYDFVTCTEAFEHFYQPHIELDRIKKILKPGALFLLMTEMVPLEKPFAQWGYRMDNTHVGFLTLKTLSWLVEHWGFEILEHQGRITVLRNK